PVFFCRVEALCRYGVLQRHRLAVHAEENALDLAVESQAVKALLATDAALLEAAKRRGNVRLLVGVEPHGACLQRAGDAPCTAVVGGPHACSQADYGVVGLSDHVLFVLGGIGPYHPRKDFFTAGPGRARQTAYDGRRIEAALGELGFRGDCAAGDDGAALGTCQVYVARNLVAVSGRHQRPHLNLRVVGKAYAHVLGGFSHRVDELAVNGLLYEETRAGHAALSRRSEDARGNAGDGMVEISVVEYDVRRFTTQLQAHGNQALACGGGDGASGLGTAGEGHHADTRVVDQRGANVFAVTGQRDQQPFRQACFGG